MRHWRKKPLTYDICIPPIKHHYYEMTDEEAQAYYDWYMDVLPGRIKYLSETAAKKLGCALSTFDLSPESLIPLWRWFITVAEKEPSTVQSEIGNNPYQLSLQTEYILRDIGMYWGQTFVVNDASLYWALRKYPKTDIFYNQPVIDGFYPLLKSRIVFQPIHTARIQGMKLLFDNKTKETNLFLVYNRWSKTAEWNRNHPCPICGTTLLFNTKIKTESGKLKYAGGVVGYVCNHCKHRFSFDEIDPNSEDHRLGPIDQNGIRSGIKIIE